MATMIDKEKKRTRSTAEAAAAGLRVFVAGIKWNLGEDVLRKDFEDCGVVEDLFLIKGNDGYSKGRCIITFRDQDGVEAALKFDNTEYAGRTIFVKVADAKPNAKADGEDTGNTSGGRTMKADDSSKGKGKGKTKDGPDKPSVGKEKSFPAVKPEGCVSLCLKGIEDSSEEDVRKLLEGCCVQSVRIVKDRATGIPRGIAFVDFVSTEDVDKAMVKNGRGINSHVVEMYYETPKARPRPEGCMSVAIKKVPADASDADVRGLFKGLDSMTDLRLIRERGTQACTGLAFAEFSKAADVEKAVKRDGMTINGHIIFVCWETKGKQDDKKKSKKTIAHIDASGTDDKDNSKKRKKDQANEDAAEPAAEPKKKKKKKAVADSHVAESQNLATEVDWKAVANSHVAEVKRKKQKKIDDAAAAGEEHQAADAGTQGINKVKKKAVAVAVAEDVSEVSLPAKKKKKKSKETAALTAIAQ